MKYLQWFKLKINEFKKFVKFKKLNFTIFQNLINSNNFQFRKFEKSAKFDLLILYQ